MTRTRTLAATLAALAVLIPQPPRSARTPPKPKPGSTPPATPVDRIKVARRGSRSS